MLSKEYDVRLILEKFSDNPFLPKFYKDPEKHAFPLELFFMAERYHQLKKNKEQDIFKPQKISDYFLLSLNCLLKIICKLMRSNCLIDFLTLSFHLLRIQI